MVSPDHNQPVFYNIQASLCVQRIDEIFIRVSYGLTVLLV